jgi:hypothetical protein
LKVREELAAIAIDEIKKEKAHLETRIANMNKRSAASSSSKIAASPIAASSPIVNTLTPTQPTIATAMIIESSVVEDKIAEPIRQSPVPVVQSPAPVELFVQAPAPAASSSSLNPAAPAFVVSKSPVLILAEEFMSKQDSVATVESMIVNSHLIEGPKRTRDESEDMNDLIDEAVEEPAVSRAQSPDQKKIKLDFTAVTPEEDGLLLYINA